jgi:hypothetical protein
MVGAGSVMCYFVYAKNAMYSDHLHWAYMRGTARDIVRITRKTFSMAKQITYFGGKATYHLVLEDGHQEEVWLEREFWFDRDIDGRWLVGATNPWRADDENFGAIVVKDPRISAFIELLGTLLAEPERFADELVLGGPAEDGRLAARQVSAHGISFVHCR